MPKTRHIPQRRCIVCSETGDKTKLLRIVREPTGTVQVDSTGKRAGRGAYICEKPECRDSAMKKGRLEAVLKTKLSQDDVTRLIDGLKQASETQEAS